MVITKTKGLKNLRHRLSQMKGIIGNAANDALHDAAESLVVSGQESHGWYSLVKEMLLTL